MKQNILIASSKAPQPEMWDAFVQQVLDCGMYSHEVEVAKLECVAGPGCVNYAMACAGEEKNIEAFANALTMALMPSRWCVTDCEPEGGYRL